MAIDPSNGRPDRRLRASRPPASGDKLLSPLPFYHHPVIAISLILVLASVVQIVVWLVGTRLPAPTTIKPSCVTAHGLLFDVLQEAVVGGSGESEVHRPAVFVMCLVIALTSGITWYAAARLAIGPAWGLWTGLCWVAHPAFAFLAPRPSALTLLIALVPVAWCALLWWRRSARASAAFAIGLTLALLSLVGVQGALLFALLLPIMLVAPADRTRRWRDAALAFAGFALLLASCVALAAPRLTQRSDQTNQLELQQQLTTHLWNAFDDGDGSPVAEAAHAERTLVPLQDRLAPWQFFASEYHKSPQAVARWFAARAGRTLYDTDDGKLRRPLLVLQLTWLLPALWGGLLAVRHRPWRWPALTAALFVAVTWLLAAFAEPRARNLTPVGGFCIIMALIAVVDLHARLSGRRRTHAIPSPPPRRPRQV